MMGMMQGKRKVGRKQIRWVEEVESSKQVNLDELNKVTRNRNAWRALHGRSPGAASDSTELRR
jgi:hypothetical protein